MPSYSSATRRKPKSRSNSPSTRIAENNAELVVQELFADDGEDPGHQLLPFDEVLEPLDLPEIEEDPAERHLLKTILLPSESYYHRIREERGRAVIDGLLSSAPNKLGPPSTVRAFNRSTGDTCCRPGSGPNGGGTLANLACRKHCYARRLEQIKMNLRRYQLNDTLVREPSIDFVKLMIGMLHASQFSCRRVHYLRIHSCGEFESPGYVRQWVKIAKASYPVSFWTYTRGWIRGDMLPALRQLHALPNVRVILSYDKTMPTAPAAYPQAYLSVDNTDLPPSGNKPLVVFRADHDQPVPQAMKNGRLFVCPHQRGSDKNVRDCAPESRFGGCGVCLPPLGG